MQRREALKRAAYAAAMFPLAAPQGAKGEAQGLPDEASFQRDAEAYWRRIREEQFLLPGWRVFLNNGSLGVAPRPVVRAVEEYLNNAAALVSDEYPRWGYETLDAHRSEIADFFGCKKDELALVHNATEAMSTIAAGIDLKAGDEVVLTDQEHPSGRSCWQVRAKRHGVSLREVKIPLPPKDPGQVADLLVSAIGPRTRVLSFSGITTTTGLITPVKEVCAAARAKGVVTVVDGAHMNGQIPFRFENLGCDFFAGSPHKWLFAPAGCGLLYVREEMLDRHWPTIVTGGWDNRDLRAAKYMMVGTNNRAIFEGLIAGLRFLKAIGPERVYARIHQLARMAYAKARSVGYLDLLTPDDDRMFGSLVTFQFKGRKLDKLWELCNQRRIWVFHAERLRISTHIHTRPADLDVFFNTMREALG